MCGVFLWAATHGTAACLSSHRADGESAGEVALYNWLEHLRERWADLAPQQQQQQQAGSSDEQAGAASAADAALAAELQAAELLEAGGESRGHAGTHQRHQREGDAVMEAAMAEVVNTVVHGEPFTEKRSTFQAGGARGMEGWSCGKVEPTS